MKHDRAPAGADPKVKDPDLSWAITLRELAAGRQASLGRLAHALRGGDSPVPRAVRDHIAGVLAGEIKRRGRPRLDVLERSILRELVDSKFAREVAALEAEGAKAPKSTARERVALDMGMSPSSVRDALARRNGWEVE
jgi:hypothetical protein